MTAKAERFLALHNEQTPLLMPNAWDVGSARLLASMGFAALATTSSGSAAAVGRLDGSLTRDEVLAHAATLAAHVEVPVSADLENCFADDPQGVADTIARAGATGLAGCSIEDFTRDRNRPIYDIALAADRVAAAAEAAHNGATRLVLTARAENHLHGRDDLDDTIRRLQRYQDAGADVLFAPGVTNPDDIRTLVAAVDRPVNVLVTRGTPPVQQLAELGVRRISVGGAFAFAALGALVDAATELRDRGTYGYLQHAKTGIEAVRRAFSAATPD